MAASDDTKRPPIAVVGVSALFPGSVNATGFWNDILAGTDRMSDVPASHWLIDDYYDADMVAPDKTYGRRGGFLDPIDFDVMEFGIPPAVVPSTDTAQLLALIVAQQVLDDATRGQFSDLDRSRVSVILGVTSGQELLGAMASRMNRPLWLQGMRRAGIAEDVAQAACERIEGLHPEWTESTFPGLLGNVVAGRIANRLDLGGTNCVTDAACASSFSSISMGVNELYLGDSDVVIAGGVDAMNDIFMYMCFSKTPALSPTEDIRPFSDQADGTMLGEGIGMVALKRLADAERDGNHVYCVINGVGSSSDGRSKSVYAPVSAGQARALSNAYDKAGYGPDTVELVEAHGTGTVAGDAAEFGGLQMAFDASQRQDRQWCALGSVKSQIGHTKAAAGAAGLFKVIMGLHHKVLPQTAKIDQPNPKLDLENSPFHLNTLTRPWIRGSDHERRGSVSSFGFGGSNFHIALSEYAGEGVRAPRLRSSDTELVVLCGSDGTDIVGQANAHRDAASERGYLLWLAQTSQRSYDAKAAARLSLVCTDEADLVAKLGEAISYIEKDPAKPFSTPTKIHYGVGAPEGDIGFVFPGQGSQYLFMGSELAMQYGEALAPWDLAADLDWYDQPLQSVVFPVSSFEEGARESQESLLTATQWAQPAIGAMSLSMVRMLSALGIEATHVGGHSFGEITALHAAGVLTEADMVRVARRRGELMAEAAQTPGAMIAVAGTIADVRALVERSGIDVVVANHNSHNQVVLSGPMPAVDAIEALLESQGVTAKRLPVATAFHSPVVSGASAAFAEFLDTIPFSAPRIPVFANETAEPYPQDAAAMRSQLGRQLANSVRFVDMVEAMYNHGVRTFVEVGPGSTLSGLIGKILNGREHRVVPLDKKNQPGMGSFFGGLGQLAAAGVAMDLNSMWDGYDDYENPHDSQAPKLTIAITGANHGTPYPPQDLNELTPPNPAVAASTAPTAPAVVTPMQQPAPTAAMASASSLAPPNAAIAPPVTAPQSVSLQPGAPRPTPPAAATTVAAAPGMLSAYQAIQQQTADAHAEYLRSMAQVHSAFLDTAQQSMALLGHLAGGPAPAARAAAPPSQMPSTQVAPAPAFPAPALPAPALPAPVFPAPVTPSPVAPLAGSPVPAPAQVAPPLVEAPIDDVPAPAATAPATATPATNGQVAPTSPSLSSDELMALLLSVVSDKTGYPTEMLTMEMELEGDLGIDSIKRVEILSAMQDQVPTLPEVDTAVMAELITLGQIVDYMFSQIQATTPTPASPPATTAPATTTSATNGQVAPTSPSLSSDELMALLLSVVSDKTGYPTEMLTMEMELEGDLGIDSIKRVEILSAMQDQVPTLPEVDTAVMAELITLGQIVDYMFSQIQATTPTPASPPATTATTTPATNRQVVPGPLDRFVVEAVAAPSPGVPTPGLSNGTVAVTDEGTGIGPALVELLTSGGVDATLTSDMPGAGYASLIYLGGLRPFATAEEAVAVNRQAFAAAREFGSANPTAVFATVSDLGGTFGLDGSDAVQAWSAGLTALARTAAIEWPTATVRAIDIARHERDAATIAASIHAELMTGASDLEIGLPADGSRVALVNTVAEVETGAMPLTSTDIVIASGGARGVAAATMIELAAVSGATFVLLGRSVLADEPAMTRAADDDRALKQILLNAATTAGTPLSPNELTKQVAAILANREINATLAAIAAAGGHARYVSLDVTDQAAVTQVVGEIRAELGPITGVVHGAGVLADKLITEKTDAQFNAVFDTKVAGLQALLAATHDDPLKMLCLFSSVAARTGNNGQADYAMANEILNKVATAEAARRGTGCVVKSLGWGPWDGGMVGPTLRAHFEAMGVSLIPLAEGARMLVDEIASPQTDQIELVLGGGVLSQTSTA